MRDRKRILLLLAALAYIVSWPVVIALDPTGGHGPQGGDPPLWGWWFVGSGLAVLACFIGWGFWELTRWAFERRDPQELERNIERLEREVGIR